MSPAFCFWLTCSRRQHKLAVESRLLFLIDEAVKQNCALLFRISDTNHTEYQRHLQHIEIQLDKKSNLFDTERS